MEDHSVVVRALCERVRKLEEQNLKLKSRIDELNGVIEAIDDGARYITIDTATARPTLIVSNNEVPASESESTVVAPESKTAGRPKKNGGNEKERERKRRWYEKKKAAKAQSKTELTSPAK
jgi:hypothetical protein